MLGRFVSRYGFPIVGLLAWDEWRRWPDQYPTRSPARKLKAPGLQIMQAANLESAQHHVNTIWGKYEDGNEGNETIAGFTSTGQIEDTVLGTRPSTPVGRNTFKASTIPRALPIAPHTKFSFVVDSPPRIAFYAESVSTTFGETVLYDMRRALAALDKHVPEFGKKLRSCRLRITNTETEKSVDVPLVRTDLETGAECLSINLDLFGAGPDRVWDLGDRMGIVRQVLTYLYLKWKSTGTTSCWVHPDGSTSPITSDERYYISHTLDMFAYRHYWQSSDLVMLNNRLWGHARPPVEMGGIRDLYLMLDWDK